MLFDADWMHTKQSTHYRDMLKKIVSVGRVEWIKDSKGTGKDNCCWYYFDKDNKELQSFLVDRHETKETRKRFYLGKS